MELKNIKFLLIIYLIGALPLALLGSSNAFASSPMFNNQSFSVKGVDNYFEDFTDQTYRAGATTAWGWGGGQLTNERNFSYITQDFYATSSICKGIDIQGRKAYLVVDHPIATDSLEILDITNPAFMIQMSSRSSYSEMISIKIHGDYIYAGLNASGQAIKTYNATDPTALGVMSGIYIDSSTVDGAVTDIETYGHLIYFTSYNSISDRALRVIDASDPDNGNLITNNWVNDKAHGLAIDGQLAYVAAAEEGFYVLNISNKHSAVECDYIPLPGFASDVVVDGRFAYIAAGEAGVHVVDVSNPHNIIWVGSIDTDGFARKLVKQGNTIYVACMDGGLFTLDVADPTNPSYVTKMVFGVDKVWDVDTFGNYIFVARDTGVSSVLAAADGGGLLDFGSNAFQSSFGDYDCRDVVVKGDIAFVAAGTDGFYTLNVRDPKNPYLLDYISPASSVDFRNLDVEGDFAYLLDENAIFIYDISNPANIVEMNIAGGTFLNDIDVEGDLMYVSFNGGFSNVNASSRVYLAPISNTNFGTNITAIDMQGHKIYSCDYTGVFSDALYCHNTVPNVLSPVLLGTEDFNSYCMDIFIDGDLAYISDSTWLVIEDVTNPSVPVYISSVDWGSAANYVQSFGVTTFGTNIINAGGPEGVHFLDAMDITPTFHTGTNYADATNALKVTTHGDFTYVANKTSLIILRHFESPGDTYVAGDFFGQSLEIDSVSGDLIRTATLDVNDYVPFGTYVDYYLSADGGANWELVTPGLEHVFVNPGDDLRWRAEFYGEKDRSVHIFDLSIDYFYNEEPTIPLLTDPGDNITVSRVDITWAASSDDAGIDHYELQVDETSGFATPISTFNVSGTTQEVTGLTNGTYYFRVRAVDIWGLPSGWSSVVDIYVEIPASNLQWWHYVIVFGGIGLVILIIVIAVTVRKRKRAAAATR